MDTSLCFLIPAYNEENSIPSIVESLKSHFPQSTVVVINDGSTDKTLEVAQKLNVVILDLVNNLGIGGAVQTGLLFASRCKFNLVVQIDGDGQHIVEEVPKLVNPVIEGSAAYVIGSRWLGDVKYQSSKGRRFGIVLLSKLVSFKSGSKFTDVTSGFRAMNNDVLNLLVNDYSKDFPEIGAILKISNSSHKVLEVSTKMLNREHGKSSITKLKSIYYMTMEIITILITSKMVRN